MCLHITNALNNIQDSFVEVVCFCLYNFTVFFVYLHTKIANYHWGLIGYCWAGGGGGGVKYLLNGFFLASGIVLPCHDEKGRTKKFTTISLHVLSPFKNFIWKSLDVILITFLYSSFHLVEVCCLTNLITRTCKNRLLYHRFFSELFLAELLVITQQFTVLIS